MYYYIVVLVIYTHVLLHSCISYIYMYYYMVVLVIYTYMYYYMVVLVI